MALQTISPSNMTHNKSKDTNQQEGEIQVMPDGTRVQYVIKADGKKVKRTFKPKKGTAEAQQTVESKHVVAKEVEKFGKGPFMKPELVKCAPTPAATAAVPASPAVVSKPREEKDVPPVPKEIKPATAAADAAPDLLKKSLLEKLQDSIDSRALMDDVSEAEVLRRVEERKIQLAKRLAKKEERRKALEEKLSANKTVQMAQKLFESNCIFSGEHRDRFQERLERQNQKEAEYEQRREQMSKAAELMKSRMEEKNATTSEINEEIMRKNAEWEAEKERRKAEKEAKKREDERKRQELKERMAARSAQENK